MPRGSEHVGFGVGELTHCHHRIHLNQAAIADSVHAALAKRVHDTSPFQRVVDSFSSASTTVRALSTMAA
jgi:hypothetical protein